MPSDYYPLTPEHWKRCFTWIIVPEVEHQLVFTSSQFRVEESGLEFELELEVERQERPGIIDFTCHTLWLKNFKANPGTVGSLQVFINRSRCAVYDHEDKVAETRIQISKADNVHPLPETDSNRRDNLITLIWTQSHVSEKRLTSKLTGDFKLLFQLRHFSDAVIQSQDRTSFDVHRAVLSARSMVLSSLLRGESDGKGGEKVIKIDYPTDSVGHLINYLYTSYLPDLPSDKAMELMKIALMYELFELREACIQLVCRSLDVSNALEILQASITYNVDTLKAKVLRFLSQNRKKLPSADYFQSMRNNTGLLLEIIDELIKE